MEKGGRAIVQLPHRCAITNRRNPCDFFERGDASLEALDLRGLVNFAQRFVKIAVVCYLVTLRRDSSYGVGVSMRRITRNEEGRLDSMLFE